MLLREILIHVGRRTWESRKLQASVKCNLIFQSDFSAVAMTRSGLSLEELRIVEGQGQNSEVVTPPEEINRMNELGKQEICSMAFFEKPMENFGPFQSVLKRDLGCP